ncbi:hypothetical protein DN820_01985 [Stutzerimonas nosocomialis]|uniref:Uncharacterized protein n=1 Tax=Stutzerimonas nosocomialis TaxID=1056496 RepID=A0A5R9QII4_9GAMM|nr:hypothetical protein [Stutzerimonas nosocomialis]TLX65104.1 hypothetical protein DN820_01985 [Stutzerimonas nosocomialis]
MTCTIFHSTEMPEGQGAKVTGSLPRKAVRWAVEYLIKTPDGRTLVESTKTIQQATVTDLMKIMDATIDALGNEAGNFATFVSWRATAHGGTKRKRGKRR